MKVLILTTQCPYITGGAEILAHGLLRELTAAGCTADIVTVPFYGDPPAKVLDSIEACRRLNIQNTVCGQVDRVIGLKFPAYLMPHPNKVMWIVHQFRQAYELFETDFGFAHLPGSGALSEEIRAQDIQGLREARQLFAISRNVSGRLQKYCDIASRTLYPPPEHAEIFRSAEAQDFFFFPSRLSFMKRQRLVLQAMAETRYPVRVVFAGAPDSPVFESRFKEEIARLGLGGRAEYLGFVPDSLKIDLYARCLGVIYPPQDEDYGYVTLEAMLSQKPVITCADSGGTLEFVSHLETGWVTEPSAPGLAEALDAAWLDRTRARMMGRAGRDLYLAAGIQWKTVIDSLLG